MAMVWAMLNGAATWAIHRLSQRSIMLACIGTPFFWVSLEVARTHLPEISFPWNLLGYPAAANVALVQLTTVTGTYGLPLLVASLKPLLPSPHPHTNSTPTR